ncbi:MAG: DUF5591 domain-containing protein [Methanothrix sp.]|nr:DUF5591 domain-containing protein [Methanothrix sp.]
MTRYFEVIRRDGPARMGRLLLERQISTPGLIGGEDIISAGSVYRYGSLEEAASAALPQDSRRLAILPYIPAALDEEPSLSLPFVQIDGPKGVVIQPFSQKIPQEADVYVIASAGVLRSGRDLVGAIARARERIPPDAALYAPAIATPAGLGLLVYLGVDLIDTTRVMADGILGRYHTVDGVSGAEDLSELPCRCRHCTMLSEDRSDRKSLIAHNVLKLEEALVSVREMIRRETVREYVERQVRVSPDQTAALRLLDQDQEYLERRTPVFRHSTLLANTAESLHRVEVTRFARRVLARYRPPRSDVLVLLPCSARKPYSASRSHQLFAQAIGQSRRHLHS